MSSRKKRLATMTIRVKPPVKLSVQLLLAKLRLKSPKKTQITENDVIEYLLQKAEPEIFKEAQEAANKEDL